LSRRLILTQEKVRGSRLAERSAKSDDPLNLMRVMPPKEARFSHAIFRAWLFCFNAQQIESGNQERRKRSDRINKINKMRLKKSGTSDSVNSLENPLPKSRKVYVAGQVHVDLRVPSLVMSSEVETSLTISLIT
jgi:hypothetical protein